MRVGIVCFAGASIKRRFLGLVAVVLAAFLPACQDSGYLQHGIGTQLPAPDMVSSTATQNQYFRLLCEQAGISSCSLPTFDRTTWTLIVRQGMNDVDRRCDAYLAWLDDRKRSRGPLLRQIGDMRSATTSILAVVEPRSAAALQIVAVAFDLITNSIENYHSRLLLEVESSTINSVVLRARHDFRKATERTAYESRPDAEYALRSYMRLCLPFAIETNINDYSTLGSRGIAPDEDNTINNIPVAGVDFLGDSKDEVDVGPPDPPRPPIAYISGARNDLEAAIPRATGKKIQAMLCLSSVDGDFSPKPVRARIEEFENALYFGKARPDGEIRAEIDSPAEFRDFKRAADNLKGCDGSIHQSAFEAGFLVTPGRLQSMSNSLICILGKSGEPEVKQKFPTLDQNALAGDRFTPTHRELIRLADLHFRANGNGQITDSLLRQVAIARATCQG